MTTTEQLNQLIETLKRQGILDASGVSDGENTFKQLYDRIAELEGKDYAKGMFEVYKNSSGGFSFRLKDKNKLTIFLSHSFSSKSECLDVISKFKEVVTDESKCKKHSGGGRCYFRVRSKTGKFIGFSELHSSEKSLDKTIEAVKAIAPTARIVHL